MITGILIGLGIACAIALGGILWIRKKLKGLNIGTDHP